MVDVKLGFCLIIVGQLFLQTVAQAAELRIRAILGMCPCLCCMVARGDGIRKVFVDSRLGVVHPALATYVADPLADSLGFSIEPKRLFELALVTMQISEERQCVAFQPALRRLTAEIERLL